MRAASWHVWAALAGLGGPAIALAWRANVEGPLPAHTGGFGEPTCAECHRGSGDGEAAVALEGLPAEWQPGERYRFDIVVTGGELRRGGFELSARFAEGAGAGTQAGDLRVEGDGGRTTTDSTGVQYAHHVYDGTSPESPGMARWTLTWTAPVEGSGAVAFHVAANAANDDNSEFGDAIVTRSDTVAAASSDRMRR